MASLLDIIRGNSNQAATQKQGVTDETQKLQGLLRAKSGKAISNPAMGASNLGEQSAVQANNEQIQGVVAPQAQIQNQTMRQQELEQDQSNKILQSETAQSRRSDDLRTQIQTDQMLADLERGKGKVDTAQYKANLDQVAQNLRLQNRQYVDDLKRNGQMSRLEDDVTFKETLQETVYGDATDLLNQKLGNKSILDANDNQFQQMTARMGANDAYAVYAADAKSRQDRALWESLAGMSQAGIGAYGSYSDSQSNEQSKQKK